MMQKTRKFNLLIWDDELGPSTRPFVAVPSTPSNASIEQPRKYCNAPIFYTFLFKYFFICHEVFVKNLIYV